MGAWIETLNLKNRLGIKRVAPYVGAWIETTSTLTWSSAPDVAPYVGAWIETPLLSYYKAWFESHPTWVRGLKLESGMLLFLAPKSHPTWVRGLKLD